MMTRDTLTGAKPSSVELPERLYSTLVLVIVIAAALLMRTFCGIDHAKNTHPRLALHGRRRTRVSRSPGAQSRPQSDQATAVKLIRALLAGRAAGHTIMEDE